MEKQQDETTTNNKLEEKEETFLGFNKEMIPCKLLFFVMNASWSSLFAFLRLYYVSSGLSVAQVGLMNGIGSGCTLIAQPLWGGMVDSAMKHKTLLFVSLSVLTTILEFGKPWVVWFVSKTETRVTCLNGTTLANSSLTGIGSNCTTSIHLLNPSVLFIATTVNSILASVVVSGLMTYMEGAIIKTIFTRKTKQSYGEQKVFAPIGMAVGTFIAGVAVDHYHPEHGLSHYLAAFYVYLPFSLMVIPLLYILTKQAKWDEGKSKKNERRKSVTQHVASSFKDPYIVMFLTSSIFSGISGCIIGYYDYLYMNDTMHPSKTVMSLTTVAASLSEFIVYPFTSKLINLCGGHMRSIIIGSFIYTVRFWILSFIKSPYLVLVLKLLLFGPSFSLSWTAMIEYTYMIFPKEITNTAIGLLTTFHWTTPSILADVFGGYLYGRFGGRWLFRVTGVINGAWVLVMIVYFGFINKRPGVDETKNSVEMAVDQIDVEEQRGGGKPRGDKVIASNDNEAFDYKDTGVEDIAEYVGTGERCPSNLDTIYNVN